MNLRPDPSGAKAGESPLDGACQELRALASEYLDGRLDEETRDGVQNHLRACPACVREVRALQRLSAHVRALPALEVEHDLAQRVREELHQRRQTTLRDLGVPGSLERRSVTVSSPRTRTVRLAAAAALLMAAFAGALRVGYLLGHNDARPSRELASTGSTTNRPPSIETRSTFPPAPDVGAELASGEVALHPVSGGAPPSESRDSGPVDDSVFWAASRNQGFDAEPYSRAVHGLFADLSSIDSVQEPLRKPLLLSQIRFFDLDSRSSRFLSLRDQLPPSERRESLARAAQLVSKLSRDVETGAAVDYRVLRNDARAAAAYTLAPPPTVDGTAPPPTRAWQVVAEVAPELPSADTGSLAMLLRLRDEWIHGRYQEPVKQAFFRYHQDGTSPEHPLRAPMDFTIALSLREVGLDPVAISFESGLDAEVQRVFVPHGAFGNLLPMRRMFEFDFHHDSGRDLRALIHELRPMLDTDLPRTFETRVGDVVFRQLTGRDHTGHNSFTVQVMVVDEVDGDAEADNDR